MYARHHIDGSRGAWIICRRFRPERRWRLQRIDASRERPTGRRIGSGRNVESYVRIADLLAAERERAEGEAGPDVEHEARGGHDELRFPGWVEPPKPE